MELVLKSADINLPQSIENLESLKAELIPRLEKYNNLVVTEDSIKAAKDDKAALNKLKKAIEEQRISIKKQYLEPYNLLESQCKEVVKLIDEPIQAIDKQIKAFDEIEKKQKFEALSDYFTSLEAPNWIHINNVLNPKWENKTQRLESLKSEMAECCEKYIAELDKLMEMYAEFPHKLAIEQKYKACLDFSQTAVYAVGLENEYKKELERKAQEEQRKLAEEASRAESTEIAPAIALTENNATIPEREQAASIVEYEQSQPILKGKFIVECTKSQLIALRDFMKSQGIKFEIVK